MFLTNKLNWLVIKQYNISFRKDSILNKAPKHSLFQWANLIQYQITCWLNFSRGLILFINMIDSEKTSSIEYSTYYLTIYSYVLYFKVSSLLRIKLDYKKLFLRSLLILLKKYNQNDSALTSWYFVLQLNWIYFIKTYFFKIKM